MKWKLALTLELVGVTNLELRGDAARTISNLPANSAKSITVFPSSSMSHISSQICLSLIPMSNSFKNDSNSP